MIIPQIKIIVGFFIGIGATMYDTGVMEIDTALAICGIVGFALFIQGTRQMMKLGGKDINNNSIR